jgi:type III restriction enzyme
MNGVSGTNGANAANGTSGVALDSQLLEEIAARLDLREPNREAIESIAMELSQHYDVDGKTATFEGVVDVATGVGKTYIMAGAIEYLMGSRGVHNVAVITPGRTILNKTVQNFTPGAPKSLLGQMVARPVVITSDNFNTPAMRAAMDDPSQLKVYIFTVQALTRPQTETGRRTHKFQEGLGQAFYEHLAALDDLVVFADEHHTYYGDAFSRAIRALAPYALIGLTATPHKKTPDDQIIYRYPLAAAIAARLVKTPVIVGRQDDRSDTQTKLLDGVRLLDYKQQAVDRYSAATGKAPVHPVMLVIARNIEEANEVGEILRAPAFMGGSYADRTLVIHSDAADEALEKLDQVEDAASPIRIIISVGMLKEGWDVKNVYVIASLRASISDILTEQTLGRGLRLAFGEYTGVEMLDTLEVLAHERYEELLRRSQALQESFIDFRTRMVLRMNAHGQRVAVRETSRVSAPIEVGQDALAFPAFPDSPLPALPPSGAPVFGVPDNGAPAVVSAEMRLQQSEQALTLTREMPPRSDTPPLLIPRLVMTRVQSSFSLADITDMEPFRRLGEQIAAEPEARLRRTTIDARILSDPTGQRHTELITTAGADAIYSQPTLQPLDASIEALRERILNAPFVPARRNQRAALQPLLDAFLQGLGGRAETILSAYFDRASDELVRLVNNEQRRFAARPQMEEVVEIERFAQVRTTRVNVTANRYGPFSKSAAYEGWAKSLYPQAWFDSEPERAVANMLDAAPDVRYWVRLEQGDLPLLWSSAGNQYHPDFVTVENDGTHWIIEVKADREMESGDVLAKADVARRWANHVSAEPEVGVRWRYLLVSQTDIASARESWAALRQRYR